MKRMLFIIALAWLVLTHLLYYKQFSAKLMMVGKSLVQKVAAK